MVHKPQEYKQEIELMHVNLRYAASITVKLLELLIKDFTNRS
jgi:hypothetical protein